MFRILISLVLTLSVNTAAADGDPSTNSVVDIELSDITKVSDDMQLFLAVITDASTSIVAETGMRAGQRYQRHLGLGFTHGMANINRQKSGGVPAKNKDHRPLGKYMLGTGKTSPRHDVCSGNGHTEKPGSVGTDSRNGNGFGLTDCGDPSPSD